MQPDIEEMNPSFFEITVAMALIISQEKKWILPLWKLGWEEDWTVQILSLLNYLIITNISWDHMNVLGDTIGEDRI